MVGYTAKLWECLTDEERLTWRVWGKTRRRPGYNRFVQANLHRVRDGQEPLRLPPPDIPPPRTRLGSW